MLFSSNKPRKHSQCTPRFRAVVFHLGDLDQRGESENHRQRSSEEGSEAAALANPLRWFAVAGVKPPRVRTLADRDSSAFFNKTSTWCKAEWQEVDQLARHRRSGQLHRTMR